MKNSRRIRWIICDKKRTGYNNSVGKLTGEITISDT
jgi:hypothetical protein